MHMSSQMTFSTYSDAVKHNTASESFSTPNLQYTKSKERNSQNPAFFPISKCGKATRKTNQTVSDKDVGSVTNFRKKQTERSSPENKLHFQAPCGQGSLPPKFSYHKLCREKSSAQNSPPRNSPEQNPIVGESSEQKQSPEKSFERKGDGILSNKDQNRSFNKRKADATFEHKNNSLMRPKVQRKKRRRNKTAKNKSIKHITNPEVKIPSKEPAQRKIQSFFTVTEKSSINETVRETDKRTSTNSRKNECESPFEEQEETLPLLGPDFQWYRERGVTVLSNMTRDDERTKSSVIMEDKEMRGLLRRSVKGTLNENIETLIEQLATAGSHKQQEHLSAMISLAKYIIDNGLIVATQDVAKKYKKLKALKESSRVESSEMLERMVKHLNVCQVYVNGKGFIIENRGADVTKILNSLDTLRTTEQRTINNKVKQAIGEEYKTILEYLDSKRDRDVLNTVLTKITSVTFVANELANVQDKRSVKRSKDLTLLNLQLFEQLKKCIKEDDVDPEDKLTAEGKRRKRHRLLQKMKLEKLRHIFEGRGRHLKYEEFPDLAGILEFAFGDSDRVDRAGGGLESHPRLTDTILYRAADNNTIMKQAREIILALAPEGFNICLSSCFNYTQNYREGTYQATRHHAGKGVNACLSLNKPPRTGVEKFVINLHWSTQNVNLTLDCGRLLSNNIMIDSKDAKAKIQADVSPVQKPGRTWRKITLPDHDWERVVHNSVTPMSHLFVETELSPGINGINNEQHVDVTRTGTAATLINLSYFEPETVQRVFNELFLLMVNPALDKFFRNPDTGRMKEHFVFIVDNGPSEAPSHPLVKMWLIRLARVLQLKSVTQKSFAEYHSKRNPVERVHGVQNRALSNDVFSSTAVYKEYKIGDERHRENMEHMADEVQTCLSNVQFGGHPCVVVRGIGKENNFVFNDESELAYFLAKSECLKNEDETQYHPVANDLWEELTTTWSLDDSFVGTYREDYQILQNSFDEDGERTCWVDKYTTTIFNPEFDLWDRNIFKLQPIPDYVRWITSGGELHYLPLAKLQLHETDVIDETPGAYLPSKILDMIFKIFKHGIDAVLSPVSFLCWCTEEDVVRFFKDTKEKLDKSYENEKEKEYWRQDALYQNHDKAALRELCKQKCLSTEGKKHELVKSLIEKDLEIHEPPPSLNKYNGDLSGVPDSINEISKLSVFRLREILRYHNVLDCGVKDELALRVGMLKRNKLYLAFRKEREAILDLMNATRSLISLQKEVYIRDPKITYRRRTFSTPSGPSLSSTRPRASASAPLNVCKTSLNVPAGITLETLQDVLNPLQLEIGVYEREEYKTTEDAQKKPSEISAIRTSGTKVLVYWSKEEIGGTGWKIGWYKGTIKKFEEEKDAVEVEFEKEKGIKYIYKVMEEVTAGRIKLAKETERSLIPYEEIIEIGATVEVKWTKEELANTTWTAGWHTAEVQSADTDEDEIDLVFLEHPGTVYTIPVLPSLISGKLRLKQQVH